MLINIYAFVAPVIFWRMWPLQILVHKKVRAVMVALLGLQCWIIRSKLDWEAASRAVFVGWWPEKNLVMWASWLLGASGKVWPDSCLIFKPYHIHSGPQYTLLLCFHKSE